MKNSKTDRDTDTDTDKSYRCPSCGRKLAVGRVIHIWVKCPRCRKFVEIKG